MKENSNGQQQQEVPVLLKVLCVLTFIGSGLTFFSNTVVYVLYKQFVEFFSQHTDLTWMGTKMDFSFFLDINPIYFLLIGLFSAMSFTGAVYMWKLKKVGFHLYAIAQIILLIIPKLFIPQLPFPVFQLAISGLFVYFYSINLKFMA